MLGNDRMLGEAAAGGEVAAADERDDAFHCAVQKAAIMKGFTYQTQTENGNKKMCLRGPTGVTERLVRSS